MKKHLLASLVFLTSLASFGASVTLSTGAACEYSGVAIGRLGNIIVTCGATATPTAPTPTPAPPGGAMGGGGSYPGPNLWLSHRLSTGDLPDGGSVEGGFTVPQGWTGTLEVPISGAYLHVYIDGVEYLGPMNVLPGPHNVKVKAQGHSANGSVDFVHSP